MWSLKFPSLHRDRYRYTTRTCTVVYSIRCWLARPLIGQDERHWKEALRLNAAYIPEKDGCLTYQVCLNNIAENLSLA